MRTLLKPVWALGVPALGACSVTQRGNALPAFPCPYATSSMTFPVDFPRLNDLGKEFLGQTRLLRSRSRSAPFPTSVDWA